MGSAPSSRNMMTMYDYADTAPTNEEKEWLTQSYRNAQKAFSSNENAFGEHLFLTILKKGKKIRQLFKFDNMEEKKILQDKEFLYHAKRLQETLEKLLSVTDMKMVKEAQRLAQMHYKKQQAGFNPMYWSIFPIVVAEIMEPYCYINDDVEKELVQLTWKKFCEHIIDIMQATYIGCSKKGDSKTIVSKKFVTNRKPKTQV